MQEKLYNMITQTIIQMNDLVIPLKVKTTINHDKLNTMALQTVGTDF